MTPAYRVRVVAAQRKLIHMEEGDHTARCG
eukprot:COSAG02_NODE_26365_length_634_cov_3.123364_1_plen_29_part_10